MIACRERGLEKLVDGDHGDHDRVGRGDIEVVELMIMVDVVIGIHRRQQNTISNPIQYQNNIIQVYSQVHLSTTLNELQ